MAIERYIVTRRHEGHGDNLNCAIAAYVLARETGRNLFINWCYSPYLRGCKARTNLFARIFRIPQLAGVEKVLAEDGMSLEGTRRRFKHGDIERFRKCEDEILILDGNHWKDYGWVPSQEDRILFLEALEFQPLIWADMQEWRRENLKGKVLGLHVRQGNGEFDGNFRGGTTPGLRKRHITDEGWFLEEVRKRVEAHSYDTLYLSCDNKQTVDMLKVYWPDLKILDKWYPPYGAGPVHKTGVRHPKPLRPAKDDMIEMYLLSYCDHVIKTQWGEYHTFHTINNKPEIENVPPSIQAAEQWGSLSTTERKSTSSTGGLYPG